MPLGVLRQYMEIPQPRPGQTGIFSFADPDRIKDVMAAAGFATGRVLMRPVERVVQPFSFNHKIHVEEAELDCDTCHEYVRIGRHSGLPSLETCLDCHDGETSESAAEQELLDFAASGAPLVFKKLFRLPDHSFYSHRQHVVAGKIECVTCHGAIHQSTVPPERPLVRITMDTCIGCHEQREVATSCAHCHR